MDQKRLFTFGTWSNALMRKSFKCSKKYSDGLIKCVLSRYFLKCFQIALYHIFRESYTIIRFNDYCPVRNNFAPIQFIVSIEFFSMVDGFRMEKVNYLRLCSSKNLQLVTQCCKYHTVNIFSSPKRPFTKYMTVHYSKLQILQVDMLYFRLVWRTWLKYSYIFRGCKWNYCRTTVIDEPIEQFQYILDTIWVSNQLNLYLQSWIIFLLMFFYCLFC